MDVLSGRDLRPSAMVRGAGLSAQLTRAEVRESGGDSGQVEPTGRAGVPNSRLRASCPDFSGQVTGRSTGPLSLSARDAPCPLAERAQSRGAGPLTAETGMHASADQMQAPMAADVGYPLPSQS
jgi:hypothetical protein